MKTYFSVHKVVWSRLLLLASVLLTTTATAQQELERPPEITETVIMLYYKDITAATKFYAESLGLQLTHNQDGAKLFRLTPTSVLGVIQEGESSYHQARSSNAVMLSLVTTDVDAWYQRLTSMGGITILKPIANSLTNPIRAFLIEDPGGYTVEFFSWLRASEPTSD